MSPVAVPCSFCKYPLLWSTTTELVETTDRPRTSPPPFFFQYTEAIFIGTVSSSSPLVKRYKLASRKPRRFLLNAYGRSSNLSSSLLMSPDWSRISFDVSPPKKRDFKPATCALFWCTLVSTKFWPSGVYRTWSPRGLAGRTSIANTESLRPPPSQQ